MAFDSWRRIRRSLPRSVRNGTESARKERSEMVVELSGGACPRCGCCCSDARMLRSSFKRRCLILAAVAVIGFAFAAPSRPFVWRGYEPRPAESNDAPWFRLPSRYAKIVTDACRRFNVPLWIACRLITQENPQWNPLARGSRNKDGTIDLGMMQINSANLKKFNSWYCHDQGFDPFDAYDSINVGLAHLRWLKDELGNWQSAILAYNAGIGNVIRGTSRDVSLDYTRRIMGSEYREGKI